MRHDGIAILALLAAIIIAPGLARAHNVIASVYGIGDTIEGEIGFSSGEMAENTLVEVFDGEGNKIGETRTDDTGFFVFTPTEPVDHVFRANLAAGHVAEATLPAEDLPAHLRAAAPAGDPGNAAGAQPERPAEAAEATPGTDAADPADRALTDAQLALVAEAVREEMRPLRREIAAYREHTDLHTILGGIGYIAGVFGIAFYLVARQRYRKG